MKVFEDLEKSNKSSSKMKEKLAKKQGQSKELADLAKKFTSALTESVDLEACPKTNPRT